MNTEKHSCTATWTTDLMLLVIGCTTLEFRQLQALLAGTIFGAQRKIIPTVGALIRGGFRHNKVLGGGCCA